MEVFLVSTAWSEDTPELDSVWSSLELADKRVSYLQGDGTDDYTASHFHVFIQQRMVDNPDKAVE